MGRDSLVRGSRFFLRLRLSCVLRKTERFQKFGEFSDKFWRLAVGSAGSRICQDNLILMELGVHAIHPDSDDSDTVNE
jgi:hypothetical protein